VVTLATSGQGDLDPAISRTIKAAPGASPLAEWTATGDVIALGLPGLGRILVRGDGIEVQASRAEQWQEVEVRLGAWARGQYLRALGYRVVPGACLVRDQQCLLITGAPRSGATSLAAALTEDGWQVLSDAVVPVDARGHVYPHRHPLRLDTVPGRSIFPHQSLACVGSGRDRITLTVPRAAGPAKITHLLDLVASRQLDRAYLQSCERTPEQILAALDIPGLLPCAPEPPPLTIAPECRRLVRPSSTDVEIVRAHLPRRLSELLADAWLGRP